MVFLLLTPVICCLLYLAAAIYLVPFLVQGSIAERLSKRIGQTVSIREVSFSPVTLRLHLADIEIENLASIAAIDSQLRPVSLLQGKIEFAAMRMEQMRATLVRSSDTGISDILAWIEGSGSRSFLPGWLRINGFYLADSQLTLDDKVNEQQHLLEEIELSLPGGTGRSGEEPFLKGIFNGSPIKIKGEQRGKGENGSETRLFLLLNDLDLEKYFSQLVGTDKLTVSSADSNAVVEILLPSPQSGEQLTLSGTLTATSLNVQSVIKNRQFKLTVPTAKLVVRASGNRFTVEELTLDAPQLVTKNDDSTDSTPLPWTAALFSQLTAPQGNIAIQQLSIKNGSLKNKHQLWNKVNLQLSGSGQQTLSLSAQREQASIQFQGTITPSMDLSGKLSLQNIEPDLLLPWLPGKELRFSKGKLDFAGTLQTVKQQNSTEAWPKIKIKDSAIQVRNFSLQQKKSKLISAAEMNLSGCTMTDRQPVCRELRFDKAEFSNGFVSLLKELSYDTLAISNSSLTLPWPAGGKKFVFLSDLTLHLTRLAGKDNLSLNAKIAGQGKVQGKGFLRKNGQGVIQLTISELQLNQHPELFSKWLIPVVKQGSLQLKGRLKLPENRFAGSFKLNDFMAESGKGQAIRWQQAAGTGVTANLAPFSATFEKLTLLQPVLQMDSDQQLPNGLFSLFRREDKKAILPPITVDHCEIVNGVLSGKTRKSKYNGVKGTVGPLAPGSPALFNLSGKMGSADFSVKGTVGRNGHSIDDFGLHQFPMKTFSPLLADQLAIEGDSGTAEWTVTPSTDVPGRLELTGLTPLPGSDYSLLLALLTDAQGSFSLELENTSPAGMIDALVVRLKKLRLQTVVSPWLVLTKTLPDLNLAQNINFFPGESTPDFIDGLDDYAQLLKQRPHLSIALQGKYDEEDEQELMQKLQTKADLQPLPEVRIQLADNILSTLALQRAEVIRNYLVDKLQIPAARIVTEEVSAGGSRVELLPVPLW